LDLPNNSAQDPFDDAEFDLPDGKELVEGFMAGLAKEVDNEYSGLSQLLATLPDPSKSLSQAEALSFSEDRFQGAGSGGIREINESFQFI
jgi:hypothetical protein